MNHSSFSLALAVLATAPFASAQWLQRSPATAPTARTAAALAYVPQNLGLVLFGGSAPLISNQTWLYDGTTWTLLAPATSPTGRFGAQLVYDPARNVAVLYGGLASNISVPPPASDTWEWDGTTWTQRTNVGNAGARYRYGACYDLGRGKVVLFGGYDGINLSDQTWLYDGPTGTWTQLVITGPKPAARNAAVLVYDSARDLCVLHGGQDASSVMSDTWTFDGTRWTPSNSTTQTIRDHAMEFFPLTNQIVKFGGFVAAPNTTSAQTWELGGASFGSGCAGSNGVPTLVASNAAVLGQPLDLNATGLALNLNLGFVVLGASKLPGVDLGILGMPGCAAFASPDVLLPIVGSAGSGTWNWPSASGPLGAFFYAQLLSLDPAANVFGAATSNALYVTLTN